MSGPQCPRAEQAALFSLGVLPPLEVRAFEAHLESGCSACEGALGRARDTVARLDLAVDRIEPTPSSTEPSASVREVLMERIRSASRSVDGTRDAGIESDFSGAERVAEDPRPWRTWTEADADGSAGVTTVAATPEEDWQSTRFDGVRVRPLSVDAERRFVTMLVKMEPGSSYPPHRHAGREECFVLEGDLHVARSRGDDLEMSAGDYQVAEEGSVHEVQSTRGGCTLLIVSSQDDVLIA